LKEFDTYLFEQRVYCIHQVDLAMSIRKLVIKARHSGLSIQILGVPTQRTFVSA